MVVAPPLTSTRVIDVPALITSPKLTRSMRRDTAPGTVTSVLLTLIAAPPALSSEPSCTSVEPVKSPPALITRTSSSSSMPVTVGSISSFGALLVPSTSTSKP